MRSAPHLLLAFVALAVASVGRADDPKTDATAYELSARLDSLRNGAAEDRPEAIRELRLLLADVERSHGGTTLEAADVLDALVAVVLRSRTEKTPDVVSLSERVIAI